MRHALAALAIGLLMTQATRADGPSEVARVRDLWKVGKYAESLEALEALAKKADNPPAIRDAIALARADCLESTGEPDRAIAVLREAAEAPDLKADNPDLWARIGDIQFDRGDWEGADSSTKRAIKANDKHLLARWNEARLLEARGALDKAVEACQWFVDYQAANNDKLVQDAPALLIIGQAAEKYIRAKFRDAVGLLGKYRMMSSPVYLEFLSGKRELTCTAWGNPTRNVRGWKGPCYLITDEHHASFRDLMDNTDWEAYGYGKDARCENCMMHCGYEPSAALGVNSRLGDSLKMLMWQLS